MQPALKLNLTATC